MRVPSVLPALALATSLGVVDPATASGRLDPRFDQDGVRIEALGLQFESLNDVLIDPQGRHVAAGRISTEVLPGVGIVQRLRPDGARDTSFAGSGVAVILPLQGPSLNLESIARQPDGKLVVAGNLFDQGTIAIQVCRLDVDGNPDPGFADSGCRIVPLWFASSEDRVFDLALQADGRIVLLAETDADELDERADWAVARLLPDGEFDPCFGDPACETGGVVIEPEPNADLPVLFPRALAIDAQQRILVAGAGRKAVDSDRDFAVVRLLPTGAVDAAFGEDGHRLVDFGLGGFFIDADSAASIALDGESIYLGGEASSDPGPLAAIVRLDANGDLDPAFDGDGRATLFFNDVYPDHVINAMRVQADGKLLVAGITADPFPSQADCAAARLLPDGQLDPVFGFDGKLAIDAALGEGPAAYDYCSGLANDGRAVVLVGYRETSASNYDTLQIRLDEDDLFRDGFEQD
jgi:uncharacterized delta-60 repeat protein